MKTSLCNRININNCFMFFIGLAMVSSITVPVNSAAQSLLEYLWNLIPSVHKGELTYFFWLYNVIGMSLLLLIMSFILYFLIRRKILFYKNVNVYILCCWSALQAVYCLYYWDISAKFLLPIVLIMVLLYFQTSNFYDQFDRLVIGVAVANALLVVIQFIHCGLQYGDFSSLRIYRPPGFMPDATLSAVFMSIAFAFILFKRYKSFWALFSCTLLICGCVFNGSRNAVVLIGCAIFIYILKRIFLKKTLLLMVCIAIMLCITLLIQELKSSLTDMIYGFLYDNTRGTRIKIALDLFATSPIWGTGLKRYGEVASTFGFSSTVHNVYAMVLSHYGILGFSLFIIPYINGIIYAIRRHCSFEACILVMLGISGLVVGVETCVTIQIIWYYIYSVIFSKKPRLLD